MEETYTPYQPNTTLPTANVGSTERMLTLLAGAALLGYAWKKQLEGARRRLGRPAAARRDRLLPGLRRHGHQQRRYQARLVGRARHSHPRIDHHQRARRKIYRFWRQLDRLPEVMPHLAKVEQLDTKRSRWTAKAFDQRAGDLGSGDHQRGAVRNDRAGRRCPARRFRTPARSRSSRQPSGSGTEVRVHLQYAAPGGKAANWLAGLAGQDPAKYTQEALQALKRKLEVPPPATPQGIAASPLH